MLLLTPGISQIYYGDETGRSLDIPDTEGDATLRSFMNWEDVNKPETKALLAHWQKLGRFRKNHPSVGAGEHSIVSESPYVFKLTLIKGDYNYSVLVALDLSKGSKTISAGEVFMDGAKVRDAYSGEETIVKNNEIIFDTPNTILLIEKID